MATGRPSRKGSTARWRRLRPLVLSRDGFVCQIQGPRCTGRADTVDHIVPYKDGGTDDISNLRAACARCNYGRRDGSSGKDPDHVPRGSW